MTTPSSEDEDALASSTADDFFELSIDNVCIAGVDGFFKRLSPSWTTSLGWSREELLAKPVLEFVHADDRKGVIEARTRLHSATPMGPLTNRYLCKDGGYRWFEWRSVSHRGQVYAVARDVTEQKLADERLRESQCVQEKLQRQLMFADRMASVGTLAAGVAHEINNPLAYVTANLSLILEELAGFDTPHASKPWAALVEMASEAQAGAERIRKIVRGLQTFSRAEEERRRAIDVLPLIEMSIDMTFNEIRPRARLVRDFGPIPLVEADEARLGQVFLNLLINAAQALSEAMADSNEIRIVTATDAQGRAVIEVRDTGSGIPAASLDRIFDPFFTTKPVGIGTGLGLSICHSVVTGMDGEITVSSVEGEGTTFRVVLPPAAGAIQIEAAIPAAPTPELVCASVLVLDDEPTVASVMRRVLRSHEVVAVTTAREALDLLDAGTRFHVIFSDLMMPEMSGMEFHGEVARRFPELTGSIVFVTGGAFTPAAHEFLDRVPNEVLEKPFSPTTLREVVQRFVDGAASH